MKPTPEGSYYEVKHPRIKSILKKIGRRIRKMLPSDLQFTLFIFSKTPNSMFYLSSLERDSGLDTIEEWVIKEKNKRRGGLS